VFVEFVFSDLSRYIDRDFLSFFLFLSLSLGVFARSFSLFIDCLLRARYSLHRFDLDGFYACSSFVYEETFIIIIIDLSLLT